MAAALEEFLWIVVLAFVFGFVMAFGIGANDVANAFGSSVSAGSLSLGAAMVIAPIMEFLGAISIGAEVTKTVRSGIFDMDEYEDEPSVLMFGELCALVTASMWLLLATACQLPVSTTHTIVAALIGFSIAAKGFDSIVWWQETGLIFIAWVASPIMAGTISFIFFGTLKYTILSAANPFERAVYAFPVVVFIGIGANMWFILNKINNVEIDNYIKGVATPIAIGTAGLFALLTFFLLVPYLKKKVQEQHENEEELVVEAKEKSNADVSDEEEVTGIQVVPDVVTEGKKLNEANSTSFNTSASSDVNESLSLSERFAKNTYKRDLRRESLSESVRAHQIWETQALYDKRTENLFQYLQVFTACLASFAHGGNDVANAIGPLSGILAIYREGSAEPKSPVYTWVLAYGGAGLALGFIFFGYNIIKAVGFKLTSITPSKGFCIELAASLAVSVASYCKIPVSTTQCLVGATCGAGIAAGGVSQVDWMFFFRTLFGWAFTFFAAAIFNAGFFSFCYYSPGYYGTN